MSKIFGIGFHKTGTTSLAAALTMLGYRVTGPNGVRDPQIALNALPMALALVPQFDAFQDNPWPILYRELDAAFPGSKYILTVRDPQSWIKSLVGHFGSRSTPMREWIYGAGSPLGHEAAYLARYENHNSDVLQHFAQRQADLLVLDITRGDGWEKLCRFLGCPIPAMAFPHRNARGAGSRD